MREEGREPDIKTKLQTAWKTSSNFFFFWQGGGVQGGFGGPHMESTAGIKAAGLVINCSKLLAQCSS